MLVYKRAMAMQKACEKAPSTMAAIIGLPDEKVEELCASVVGETVILANYNSPGQAVISGSIAGVEKVIDLAKEAGAKRALPLNVSGAFHSPFMESAREELEAAIKETSFNTPRCPIYQNVDALPHTDPEEIRQNLIKQLTAPVRGHRLYSICARMALQNSRNMVLARCYKGLSSELSNPLFGGSDIFCIFAIA